MQKVVSINLGGSVFQVDEDAYDLLRNYVEAVRTHFKGTEGGFEISNDIEQRLAEMFQARVASNANLINKQMVEEVMALMGRPSDFETDGEPTSNQASAKETAKPLIKRKLFRDPDNRMLGGICAGLGAYFGIGRWVFRVLILALLFVPFFHGTGWIVVLMYFIFWIAVPKAKTMTDKMQMKGQPINISSFEKNFRSTFSMVSKKPFARDIPNKIIGGVGSGIANYFDTQVWVVRVLFLITFFFFGTGLLVYLILWVSVPKGSPFAEQQSASMYDTAKINVTKTSGPMGGFLGTLIGFVEEVIRIAGRLIARISGFVLLICVLLVTGAVLIFSSTISNYWFVIFNNINDFNFAKIAAWVVIGIPCAMGLTLAAFFLGRKVRINVAMGLIFFIAWIIAAGLGAYYTLQIWRDFVVYKDNSQKITLTPSGGLIDIMSSGEPFPSNNFSFDNTHGFVIGDMAVMDSTIYSKWVVLKIIQTESVEAELYYNVSAFGKDTLTAISNQKMISYNLSQSNNDLILSPYFTIPAKSKWRGQTVRMELKLPVGYKVRLNQEAAGQLDIEGLPEDKEPLRLIGKTLEMTKEGLKCTDC